ncbi:hypothetical protein BB561_000459 [Smittium simulii]|uniref:DUF3020 domain-containing protein n=1 Tax=Smittium simulii TaxID=133385 RepID=A0A2T9YZ35_9FUNG|nr:hypothetical protein BB561_000459 [Smittium simulii]
MKPKKTLSSGTSIRKLLDEVEKNNEKKPEFLEQIDKIRKENRERKKKWRQLNQEKNKNNDLRCRVNKRANKIFGYGDNSEKQTWICSEMKRRLARRQEKERFKQKPPLASIFSIDSSFNAARTSALQPYTPSLRSSMPPSSESSLDSNSDNKQYISHKYGQHAFNHNYSMSFGLNLHTNFFGSQKLSSNHPYNSNKTHDINNDIDINRSLGEVHKIDQSDFRNKLIAYSQCQNKTPDQHQDEYQNYQNKTPDQYRAKYKNYQDNTPDNYRNEYKSYQDNTPDNYRNEKKNYQNKTPDQYRAEYKNYQNNTPDNYQNEYKNYQNKTLDQYRNEYKSHKNRIHSKHLFERGDYQTKAQGQYDREHESYQNYIQSQLESQNNIKTTCSNSKKEIMSLAQAQSANSSSNNTVCYRHSLSTDNNKDLFLPPIKTILSNILKAKSEYKSVEIKEKFTTPLESQEDTRKDFKTSTLDLYINNTQTSRDKPQTEFLHCKNRPTSISFIVNNF